MAGASTQRFEAFYADLKQTEKKDAVLTSTQQIDRLLRPGSTYRNLNPYEVLGVNADDAMDVVKKKFRRLSILVHPDKNQDDAERAMSAFDAVKKASSPAIHKQRTALNSRLFRPMRCWRTRPSERNASRW